MSILVALFLLFLASAAPATAQERPADVSAPVTSPDLSTTPVPAPPPTRTPRLGGGPEAPSAGRPIGTGGASLADIARRQKEQREREGKKPSLGVITNETLRKGAPAGTPTPAPLSAKGGKGKASPTPVPRAPTPALPVIPEWRDQKGRTEADWRRITGEVRASQAAAEARVKTLDAEVRRLENDFYAWSDGNYRDRVIRPAWDQARDDLAKARQDLDASRARMGELEEDARKSNAPPGWLR
jgi:hypothetical protein